MKSLSNTLTVIFIFHIFKFIQGFPIPCPYLNEKVEIAHRGGDVTRFQENTIEIAMDAVSRGYGIEIDLMQLGSGEVIVFHDSNFETKVGVKKPVSQTNWKDVHNFRYLTSYEGLKYKSRPSIPLLSEMLKQICTINPKVGIWLDIKTYVGPSYAKGLLDAFVHSPCACDDSQMIIIEMYGNTDQMDHLRQLFSNSRCTIHTAYGYYEFHVQPTYKQMLNTVSKITDASQVIDSHQKMWLEHPQLVDDLRKLGICTAVYGDHLSSSFSEDRNKVNIVMKDFVWTNYNLKKKLVKN